MAGGEIVPDTENDPTPLFDPVKIADPATTPPPVAP